MSEFLAEARILVRPDTTRFRAELVAQLEAATRGITAPVPIQTQITTTGAARAAQEAAGALRVQEQAATSAAASNSELARIQRLSAVSAADLARSQLLIANASNAVAAAQIELGVAVRAVARQEQILSAALATGNVELIKAAALTSVLTRARFEEASAALAAARAEATHAASLENVRKAGIASGAGLLGLRGAVLTAGAGFIAATVGIQAFVQAVQSAAELETQLNVFRATAGATATEMERVSAAATELGSDLALPGVSASDAAEALTELAKAGLTVQESIAGARGVLELSTAAQIDTVRSAELVANALNAFGLAGERATDVADLLAGASIEAQGSIEDMGLALKQSAAVADLVGLEIEDTVGIITLLARSGIQGSDAGTSLRTALIRLVNPTKAVREQLEELDTALVDIDGNIRPEFFFELRDALNELEPAARRQAVAILGGSDAIRTFARLSDQGLPAFREVVDSITEQGIAAQLSSAQTEGLAGDAERLSNEMATLGRNIGAVASGPLGALTRAAASAAGAINDVTAEAQEVGFFEAFGDAIGRLGTRFADLNFQFQTAVRASALGRGEFNAFKAVVDSVTTSVEDLANALKEAAEATIATQGLPKDEGLGVQQILNRVEGFDAAEVRARISGDNQELLAVLQAEQAFLQSQLERQFVKNRPALRRQLESQLLGVTNDIAAIEKEAAGAAQKLANEAEANRKAQQQAFLTQQQNQRDAAQNAISAADTTQEAIRAQIAFQALLRRQIAAIRKSTLSQQEKTAAINELRSALIASNNAEDALKAQRAREKAQAQEEIQNLNIQIAQEKGNAALLEKRIRQRLTTINNAIQSGKVEGVALKRLILERERLRNQLEDLDKVDEETKEDARKRASSFFFEQLQAQQGFAANLLGNLIPAGDTEGLVGVPSPAPPPGAQIAAEARAAQGRSLTAPTAGQVSTTNTILQRILIELKALNRGADAPEAIYQRKMGSATMAGGGGNVEVM